MPFVLHVVVAFGAYAAIATTSEFNASQVPEMQQVACQADCDITPERDQNSQRNLQTAPLEVRVGGTLSLSTHLAWDEYQTTRALYTYRGYTLLQEAVNSEGIFQGRPPILTKSGRPIKITFSILDDHLDLLRSRAMYQEMFNNGTTDYYLGPIGADFAAQAAQMTNGIGAFMIASTSVSRNLTAKGYPYLFSTNFYANTSLVTTLDMLKQKGAKTVAFIWQEGTVTRYKGECVAGMKYANSTGWTVRWHWVMDQLTIPRDIRRCQSYKPDVLIACCDIVHGTSLLMSARAFSFNLKALVMTQAGNKNFVDIVKPSNAILLYAPAPWHWDAPNQEDPIFNSALGFKAAWNLRFGGFPEFHGAAAAAAGEALVLALQNLDKIATPAELRQYLLKMDENCFYHRLRFHTDGALFDQTYHTIQVKAYTEGTELERYQKSKLVLVALNVNGVEEPYYPSPSWELKESLIYPCDVGHVMNESSELNLTCIGCAPGRSRPRTILQCMLCPIGRYNNEEGLENCKLCPYGADCGARGVVHPGSSPGFYLLDSGVNIECNPRELCVGNNKCVGSNDGVMCAGCKKGHTVRGLFAQSIYMCNECPSIPFNVILLMLACGAWLLIVFFIGYLTVNSSCSVKSMHSIILKKVVNHLNLVSTAWTAGELDDLFNMRIFTGIGNDPLQQIVSLDCLLRDAGVALHEATTYIGLGLIPLALILNTSFFALNFFLGMRAFQQQIQDVKDDKEEAAQKKQIEKKVKKERGKIGKSQEGHKEPAPAPEHEDSSSDSELETAQLTLKHQWLKLQDRTMFYVQWSIVWVFVLHPISVKLLLDGIRCDELDVFRLNFDYNILCNSVEHRVYFQMCVVGVVVYGIGIPLVFFFLLYRVRHKLMHLRVRKLFGFLYNGFEAPWYYFEVLYMLRKVFLLLLAVNPVIPLRIGSMLVMSFIFLAVHIFCNPYDNRDFFVLDKLETCSLICLVLILQTKMFYILRNLAKADTFISNLVWAPFWNYCLWTAVGLANLWFWFLAFSSLIRNSVLKYIHLKVECALDRVNCFERLLVRLDYRHHKVTFNSKKNTLDTSHLSKEEKYFLQQALWDTIGVYLDSDKHFHGGLLLTSVKRALHMCTQDREYRKKQMLTIMADAEDSEDQGFLATTRAWQAQLANVTETGRGQKADDKGRISKSSKKASKAQARLQEFEDNLRKQDQTMMSVTVEELQNALMLCWADIIIHTPRFFVLEKPPPELKESVGRTTTHMLDDLLQNLNQEVVIDYSAKAEKRAQADAIKEKKAYEAGEYEKAVRLKLKQREEESAMGLTPQDLQEVEASYEKALPLSTVQLRRRHVEVVQDLWLQKVELQSLKEHMSTLVKTGLSDDYKEHVDSVLKNPNAKADDDADIHYSLQQSHIKKSLHLVKTDLQVDVSFLTDEHAEAFAFGQKLVETVTSIREFQLLPLAVDTLIHGSKILALHFARHSALDVPDGGELAGASPNPFEKDTSEHHDHRHHFDPEAKVIACLKDGQGWTDLSKHALHAVDQLKQIAQKIRKLSTDLEDKYAKEANALEAWALNVSRGLVSGKGFVDGHTEMDEHDLLGWRNSHSARFEARLAHLLEHLNLLKRDDEAEIIQGLVDRLLMMGHMAIIKQEQSEGEHSQHSIRRDECKAELEQMVKDDWEELAPVAVETVEELEKVASTFQKEGLEEESCAVSGMIDELISELLAIYQITVADEEETDSNDVRESSGAAAVVDNGAGVLL